MNIISLLSPYVLALILTLIIEGTLCWLFLRDKAWLRFICLVNLFTNPFINALYAVLCLLLTKNSPESSVSWLLLSLELIVWLSEALLFYRFGNSKKPISSIYNALFFSFVLNAATYLSGLLLQL